MIPIKTTVKREHGVTIRNFKDASKKAWQEAGEFWHHDILRKHFTQSGADEYRAAATAREYKKRTDGYLKRKLRKVGHSIPLVFSGNLMRSVLSQAQIRVVGDGGKRAGRAKITLRGPRYLYLHRKRFNDADKAAELRIITGKEGKRIAQLMDEVLTLELDKNTGR